MASLEEIPKEQLDQALSLLCEKFSLLSISGRIYGLDNENVETILHGDVDTTMIGLDFYSRTDATILMERLLERSDIPIHEKYIRVVIKNWLKSPKTKMYKRIAFSPIEQPADVLNLYRGPIEAIEGDWTIIRNFLYEVICGEDEERTEYLLNYLAHAIQKPEEKPEIMISLQSEQGDGKGTFFELIKAMWPHTTVFVQKTDQITGRFNEALSHSFFVLSDEAWFSGDKKTNAALKSVITERHIVVEQKNKPSRVINSHHRFIAASNEDKIANVSPKDRRFAMYPVSSKYRQNHDYFGALRQAIIQKKHKTEVHAFVHHLAKRDLTNFNIRKRPLTQLHAEQKLDSLDSPQSWLVNIIETRQVNDLFNLSETDPLWVPTKVLLNAYLDYDSNAERYGKKSNHWLIRQIKKVYPNLSDKRPASTDRSRGLWLPPLPEMRLLFNQWIGYAFDWDGTNESQKISGQNGSSGLSPLPNNYEEAKWGA